MKRFHALEWEDLEWFPASWRDFGTDYLRFLAQKFKLYKPIIPVLEKGLNATAQQDWVDCASGGGSALLSLAKELKPAYPKLRITLTDYFPNHSAFLRTQKEDSEVFSYESGSVDAMNMPEHLHGKLRTLFGSFHHFRPKQAQQILQNAVDSNSPIAIFEPVGRNFMSFFSMLFMPLQVILLAPFVRPVRWQTLPFIYLLPLIPLYIMWDGMASIFRNYSEPEMKDLISRVKDADRFDWETGKKQNGPMPVHYLIGIPKKAG